MYVETIKISKYIIGVNLCTHKCQLCKGRVYIETFKEMTIACKEIKQHKQTNNKLTQNPVQSKVAALKTVQKHLCVI